MVTQAATDSTRTAVFARYSLVGSFAAAAGALAAGTPDGLAALGLGEVPALRVMFLLYALLGVACWIAYRKLPRLPADWFCAQRWAWRMQIPGARRPLPLHRCVCPPQAPPPRVKQTPRLASRAAPNWANAFRTRPAAKGPPSCSVTG